MTNPLLAPADPTADQAQQAAGFDPSSIISAVEGGLLDFLKMPMQQKLNGLPLQQFPQVQHGTSRLRRSLQQLQSLTFCTVFDLTQQ